MGYMVTNRNLPNYLVAWKISYPIFELMICYGELFARRTIQVRSILVTRASIMSSPMDIDETYFD